MNYYTVYNSEKIICILNCSEETRDLNINEGESYVEGQFSDDLYYVKDSEIKEYPEKPDFPVTFDKDAEQWVWDEDISWGQLRDERDRLLSENVDPIVTNPLRWDSMTTEKKSEVTVYRQALLDLPENTSDARNPIYPTEPT